MDGSKHRVVSRTHLGGAPHRLTFDRFGQFFQLRRNRCVEGVTVIGQLHRLVLAGEQALASEVFQRSDASR